MLLSRLSRLKDLKRSLRGRFGTLLQSAAHKTGLMYLSARIRHIRGAVILMYHSVAEEAEAHWIDPRDHVPPDVFQRQMEYLAAHNRVVGLGALVGLLSEGREPQSGTVVITFDDGYLDNLTVAAPILERFALRATLFLPTSYIDRGETQWVDQVYSAFKYRTSRLLTWGPPAQKPFDLDDANEHAAAYLSVCQTLLTASPDSKRAWLADLLAQIQPSECPPRLTMTWDDVKTLLAAYRCFELGAHTLEHTDLTAVGETQARNELAASMRRVSEVTGIRPRALSFPYGRTSALLRSIAFQEGFQCACGAAGSDPIVSSSTDPFALPRVAAPWSMRRFRLATDASNTGFWRRLAR